MTPKSVAEVAGYSVKPRKDTKGTFGILLINCLGLIKRSLVLLGVIRKMCCIALLGHVVLVLVQASQLLNQPLPEGMTGILASHPRMILGCKH